MEEEEEKRKKRSRRGGGKRMRKSHTNGQRKDEQMLGFSNHLGGVS